MPSLICTGRSMSCAGPTHALGGSRHHSICRHLHSALPFIVLLVMVACHMCELVSADPAAQSREASLFASRKTMLPGMPGGAEIGGAVRFMSPSLVAADDVMVALAGAVYTRNATRDVDIVARFVDTEGAMWAERAAKGNWETQLVMRRSREWNYTNSFVTPMAVAKGTKIYLLLVNYNRSADKNVFPSVSHWDLEFVVGETVRPETGADGAGKRIEWKKADLPHFDIAHQLKEQSLVLNPSAGSAFPTADGQVVFVLPATGAGRSVSIIIYSKIAGNETEWDWSYVETSADCYFPSFVWLEGKLVMIPKYCSGQDHKVKESSDMGKTWADASGPIARRWDQLQNKDTFATVTIENRTVLLLTQLKSKKRKDKKDDYEISLWVFDGSRVREIGPIVTDDRLVCSNSLVYTNGELFSLHQRLEKRSTSTFLLRLNDQLDKIKYKLGTSDTEDD